jgi:hypothetical protein
LAIESEDLFLYQRLQLNFLENINCLGVKYKHCHFKAVWDQLFYTSKIIFKQNRFLLCENSQQLTHTLAAQDFTGEKIYVWQLVQSLYLLLLKVV